MRLSADRSRVANGDGAIHFAMPFEEPGNLILLLASVIAGDDQNLIALNLSLGVRESKADITPDSFDVRRRCQTKLITCFFHRSPLQSALVRPRGSSSRSGSAKQDLTESKDAVTSGDRELFAETRA